MSFWVTSKPIHEAASQKVPLTRPLLPLRRPATYRGATRDSLRKARVFKAAEEQDLTVPKIMQTKRSHKAKFELALLTSSLKKQHPWNKTYKICGLAEASFSWATRVQYWRFAAGILTAKGKRPLIASDVVLFMVKGEKEKAALPKYTGIDNEIDNEIDNKIDNEIDNERARKESMIIERMVWRPWRYL